MCEIISYKGNRRERVGGKEREERKERERERGRERVSNHTPELVEVTD